jgi:hypothetical protein
VGVGWGVGWGWGGGGVGGGVGVGWGWGGGWGWGWGGGWEVCCCDMHICPPHKSCPTSVFAQSSSKERMQARRTAPARRSAPQSPACPSAAAPAGSAGRRAPGSASGRLVWLWLRLRFSGWGGCGCGWGTVPPDFSLAVSTMPKTTEISTQQVTPKQSQRARIPPIPHPPAWPPSNQACSWCCGTEGTRSRSTAATTDSNEYDVSLSSERMRRQRFRTMRPGVVLNYVI